MRTSISTVLILLLASCSKGASSPEVQAVQYASVQSTAGGAPSAQDAAAPQPSASPTSPTDWATQKLIRSAELRVQVKDVTAAARGADSIAQASHALVADSRTTQDADGLRTSEILLRVPSQDFPALLRAVRGLGVVKSESVNTQDVTKEYADLETRLAVKEQTVARLRALLDNRTAKLSDVLEVERALSDAITMLEQMKGERRYLDQQIAMSTVRLTLFERTPSQVSQITRPIGDALRSAMDVLGRSIGAAIYFIVALVPWVLVALGVIWLVPAWRRRFLSRSARTPEHDA